MIAVIGNKQSPVTVNVAQKTVRRWWTETSDFDGAALELDRWVKEEP
jgi:hypothetical protein